MTTGNTSALRRLQSKRIHLTLCKDANKTSVMVKGLSLLSKKNTVRNIQEEEQMVKIKVKTHAN